MLPGLGLCEPAANTLRDPIPGKILQSDIVVEAVEFVRAPRTVDSSPLGANEAYARIQYLLPGPSGSGRLFFNDLRGLLYHTNMDGDAPVVYLDLREQDLGFDDSMFPNETGLVGFAFHPDFSADGTPGFGKFYTAFSARSDSGDADFLADDAASHHSVIREWTVDNPGAEVFSGSSREVLRVGQFAPNHNVGTIAFNPHLSADSPGYGLLYICLGDGGAANDPRNYGQGLREPLGAILRIDPLGAREDRGYSVPADNPFAGRADVAQEIWAYGLRHAQHFSWDTNGRMFIADIGQNQVEEINLGVAGGNYGWRLREGTFATAFAFPGEKPGPVYPLPSGDPEVFFYPVAQNDHVEGNAVAGGFVYRGSRIAELRGKYVFAELVRGRLLFIEPEDLSPGRPAQIREIRLLFDGIERNLVDVAGFANTYAPGARVDLRLGIDASGELYLLTKGDGWVRKLVPGPSARRVGFGSGYPGDGVR